MEAGAFDVDGVRHSTKVAWRALANLQKELEAWMRATDVADTTGWPADVDIPKRDPYAPLRTEQEIIDYIALLNL